MTTYTITVAVEGSVEDALGIIEAQTELLESALAEEGIDAVVTIEPLVTDTRP